MACRWWRPHAPPKACTPSTSTIFWSPTTGSHSPPKSAGFIATATSGSGWPKTGESTSTAISRWTRRAGRLNPCCPNWGVATDGRQVPSKTPIAPTESCAIAGPSTQSAHGADVRDGLQPAQQRAELFQIFDFKQKLDTHRFRLFSAIGMHGADAQPVVRDDRAYILDQIAPVPGVDSHPHRVAGADVV